MSLNKQFDDSSFATTSELYQDDVYVPLLDETSEIQDETREPPPSFPSLFPSMRWYVPYYFPRHCLPHVPQYFLFSFLQLDSSSNS